MPAAYIDREKLADLALQLRGARRCMGLTQEDVARSAGCSRSLVSRIEAGNRTLTIQRAEAFASSLGLPKCDLIDAATNMRVRRPWLIAPLPRITHWAQIARRFQGVHRATVLGLLGARGDGATTLLDSVAADAAVMVRMLQAAAFEHPCREARAAAQDALAALSDAASEAHSPFRARAAAQEPESSSR